MPSDTKEREEEEKAEDVEMEEEDDDDDDDSADEEDDSEDESGDSDKELQIAFEKGLLKPGLFKEEEQTKKEHVNNVEGLKAALVNFQTKNKFEWAERLDVTTNPAPDVTGAATSDDQPLDKNA